MLQFSQFSLFPVWRVPPGFSNKNQGEIHETTTPKPSLRRVGNDALFLYPDFVSGECRRRVMHNPKKGARHGQKRKRRKERKEAKERKEDKEKTIPGFITKPNISTACAYVRTRG